MSAEEVLRRAARLVERGWVQDEFARDERGNVVNPESPAACEWCAMGALMRAAAEDAAPDEARVSCLPYLPSGLVRWNDAEGRTQADAVEMFTEAAKWAAKDRAQREVRS